MIFDQYRRQVTNIAVALGNPTDMAGVDLPNVGVFSKQTAELKQMLMQARPSAEQTSDIDFLLALGQMFTLVVYGQLILENAKICNIDDDTIDQIFEFMVRDFSAYALQLRDKPSVSESQQEHCRQMMLRPAVDTDRFDRVWQEHVFTIRGKYTMNE